jgi:hypothetical protein
MHDVCARRAARVAVSTVNSVQFQRAAATDPDDHACRKYWGKFISCYLGGCQFCRLYAEKRASASACADTTDIHHELAYHVHLTIVGHAGTRLSSKPVYAGTS